jgi:hypothetical protein
VNTVKVMIRAKFDGKYPQVTPNFDEAVSTQAEPKLNINSSLLTAIP